jgi:hypothetical protein
MWNPWHLMPVLVSTTCNRDGFTLITVFNHVSFLSFSILSLEACTVGTDWMWCSLHIWWDEAVGSVPYEVPGIFTWPNPSSCVTAWDQLSILMITRNLPGVKRQPVYSVQDWQTFKVISVLHSTSRNILYGTSVAPESLHNITLLYCSG